MATLASTQKTVTMSNHADCFPFLQLPGELRNQVYCNVFRLDEIPYVKLLLPETLVCSTEDIRLKVWTSRQGLHNRIPASGVEILPILKTLEHIHGVGVSFHTWCVFSWELAITHMLHKTFSQWRSETTKLGLLDMILRSDYNEDTTGLRTLHDHVGGLTIAFITPKTKRGQASEMKFSVFKDSVKMEWTCQSNYCLARLVDSKNASGFKVEKKHVEGNDILRLDGEREKHLDVTNLCKDVLLASRVEALALWNGVEVAPYGRFSSRRLAKSFQQVSGYLLLVWSAMASFRHSGIANTCDDTPFTVKPTRCIPEVYSHMSYDSAMLRARLLAGPEVIRLFSLKAVAVQFTMGSVTAAQPGRHRENPGRDFCSSRDTETHRAKRCPVHLSTRQSRKLSLSHPARTYTGGSIA
ncbi:hypothetical protein PMIN01_13205 [Paraphaeosphaeria minitans]|uniref:Uncharacterized protein n=1 Tax=Paraphaeosphaeria minitans TaxID=565426 RepID=A0A9P6G6M0_9PLEO|nr:hypothetical protein PMIN01_13205 [Paraphaeosphaeria minitans]